MSTPDGDVTGGDSTPRNLSQQRKLAKDLLKSARAGDTEAIARLRAQLDELSGREPQLADAQRAVAREAGFDSWPKLVAELEQIELRGFRGALDRGDARAVQRMISASPSVRRKLNDPIGDFGARPVQVAAKHRAVLDVLIDAGADINLRSDWEKGPYSVFDSCDEPTARHLISRGARLTAHGAARLGWIDELRAIVDADPDIVHEKGGDGQRPLHWSKTVEIADFLLGRGAEVDARCDDHHSTAAQYALVDRPELCQYLLSRGASPDIFMPARLGDVELARKLIDKDPACVAARVNAKGYAPVPPMHIYCWTLGFYASPHDAARRFGHNEVYEMLLRHSPPKVRFLDGIARGGEDGEAVARAAIAEDPSLPASLPPDEHALLPMAVFHGRIEVARLMLRLGFDPMARGVDGGTTLHAAAWVGSAEMVDALISRKADVNLPDPTHGSPPLGWAAFGSVMRRHPDGDYVGVIERLAAAGADVRSPGNRSGKSMVVMAEGNPTVQAVLKRLGAS